MRTKIIKINSRSPEPLNVEKVANILRNGGIVGIPTETVYGLVVNADDKKAVDRLYEVKNRPKEKSFTIQIANFSQLKDYLNEIPPKLEILLNECWPGTLTIIVNGKKGKVGIRMPNNKVALSIIEAAKIPLAVTSANISGAPAAISSKEVIKMFDGMIDLIVEDGDVAEGIESTVLDCTVSPYKILRKGLLTGKLEIFLKLYG